jgi:hypothetical protein
VKPGPDATRRAAGVGGLVLAGIPSRMRCAHYRVRWDKIGSKDMKCSNISERCGVSLRRDTMVSEREEERQALDARAGAWLDAAIAPKASRIARLCKRSSSSPPTM